MSGYSIVILICSTALSHADCRPNTALDLVRGPQVDNPMICMMNAETMIARTGLLRSAYPQYMEVVCAPSKNIDQWRTEIEARKAAVH